MNGKFHSDHEFEQELTQLKEKLLLMGAKVEAMVASAMKAFADRDPQLALRVIGMDKDVDRLEKDIDGFCMMLLVRRQPVASDLRFTTMALKLVTDLERIGDLAVNIGERVVDFADDPPRREYPDLLAMAETVQEMVREALDAFVGRQVARAQAVIARDREVDAAYVQIFRQVLAVMMADPTAIPRGMRVQSIAKYVERIGDHATNLAEMVVFLVEGRDIRHPEGPAQA